MEKEAALIEAILFLESDTLDIASLARISGFSRELVEKVLDVLEERYNDNRSGLSLSRIGGGIALGPKPEYWEALRERYGKKSEGRLSKAALETLSIIAYSQPITRSEIEGIRGVSADNMMRLLLERELIRSVGKKDVPGKPTLYGTTKDFLKVFRLESLADLPKLDESEADRFELNG